MADSITRIIVFFTFTQGWIAAPLLLVFVFLYREFIITTLRTVCAFEGFALGARKSGKTKAIIQASVNLFIVILMIPYTLKSISLLTLRLISIWAIAFAAIFSALTAIEYIYANRKYLKKIL
jgi:CDP-diacylglycerol--glycerol-3-phosphate 3-phosphatidyltransferase